ncbi:hypothetical protein ES703_11330 [subsurface metagenome]
MSFTVYIFSQWPRTKGGEWTYLSKVSFTGSASMRSRG